MLRQIIAEKLIFSTLIQSKYFLLCVFFFSTLKDFNAYMPLFQNGPRERKELSIFTCEKQLIFSLGEQM